MIRTLLATGLVAGLAATSPPGHAQTGCAPRDLVVERLMGSFGEGLAAGGLRSESQVIEVWASADTGTWTVLMTRADGLSCVMASGTNWHQQDPALAALGTPG